MATANGAASIQAQTFKNSFDQTFGLILEEWPGIGIDRLKATEGEIEKVVDLVSEMAGRSKTAVRRQLAELNELAQKVDGEDGILGKEMRRLREIVDSLETRSHELVDYAKTEFPKDARNRVERNLWTSLLMAIGLGFIVGFFARGSAR